MKYNKLYKEYFDSRDFIQKYEFSKNKEGKSIIIVTYGSDEKVILEDNDANRLLLKEYDEKIKYQVNSVILKRAKIIQDKPIKHLKFKLLYVILSLAIFFCISFNFELYINLYNQYVFLTALTGAFAFGSFLAVFISYIKNTFLHFEHIQTLESDIHKNVVFMRIEEILKKSLQYNNRELINDLKEKKQELIMDAIDRDCFGIGIVDNIDDAEMRYIENKILELKRASNSSYLYGDGCKENAKKLVYNKRP